MFLAVATYPVAAATVTLSCKWDTAPGAIALRVDYATGLVEEVGGERANGKVSENAIVWSGTRTYVTTAMDNVTRREETVLFDGRINRLTGTGYIQVGHRGYAVPMPVTCASATAPKF